MSMKLQLVIGDKAYSSWSMRPWLLMTQAGIAFEEVQLQFAEQNGQLVTPGVEKWSPTGLVPAMWLDDGGARECVWDTLAIAEALNDLYPNKQLWPADATARRLARAISAEMHSGFRALRGNMPVNVVKQYIGKGMNADVQKDVDRISAIWTQCRTAYAKDGAFLFGSFSIADAMYAPIATRFATYGVPLTGAALAYQQTILSCDAMVKWVAAAKREYHFLKLEEPYA
jgi:glutathione S-transferase